MNFQIAFNSFDDKNDNKEFYEFIGAELVSGDEDYYYTINIDSCEDLKILLQKINMRYFGNTFEYSAVINFDPATIYLDNKV